MKVKTEVNFQSLRGSGTWISFPTQQARAICSDGRLRRTMSMGNAFQSGPNSIAYRAVISLKGKAISGYLEQHLDGLHFHCNRGGRNAAPLIRG